MALDINLLGGFEAHLGSGEALLLKGRKTRPLLLQPPSGNASDLGAPRPRPSSTHGQSAGLASSQQVIKLFAGFGPHEGGGWVGDLGLELRPLLRREREQLDDLLARGKTG